MLRMEGPLTVLAEGSSSSSHRGRARRGGFVVRDEVGSGVEVHLEDHEEGGGVGVHEEGEEVEEGHPRRRSRSRGWGGPRVVKGMQKMSATKKLERQGADDPWTGVVLANVWVSKLVSLNPFSAGRVVMVVARAKCLEPLCMLCHVMICYVMFCRVMVCYVMFCYGM